jgi:hypothetical protein
LIPGKGLPAARQPCYSHPMSDLIFWTVLLVALFFGFRWLQRRKKDD